MLDTLGISVQELDCYAGSAWDTNRAPCTSMSHLLHQCGRASVGDRGLPIQVALMEAGHVVPSRQKS